MSDHVWLINTRALFSGSRYIMRVAPTHKKPTEGEITEEAVVEMGEFVGARVDQTTEVIKQRISFVE